MQVAIALPVGFVRSSDETRRAERAREYVGESTTRDEEGPTTRDEEGPRSVFRFSQTAGREGRTES
jgi:hypothetical protein